MSAPSDRSIPADRPVVVVQAPRRRFTFWLLMLVLLISVAFNLMLYSAWHTYFGYGEGVVERFHSGDPLATDKIALVAVEGTIIPPFTGHVLDASKPASRDDSGKGLVLVVNSPGSLLPDSEEVYHGLRERNR